MTASAALRRHVDIVKFNRDMLSRFRDLANLLLPWGFWRWNRKARRNVAAFFHAAAPIPAGEKDERGSKSDNRDH